MAIRTLNEKPAYIQLISFGFYLIAGTVLFSLLAYVLAIPIWGKEVVLSATNIGITVSESQANVLKFIQAFGHFGMFTAPSLFFAFQLKKPLTETLNLGTIKNQKVYLITVALVALSMPISNLLITINESIKLPESLASLELWLKEKEAMASQLTEVIAKTSSFKGLMVNLFVMAFLPAIGEELVFRGILLKYAIRFTHKIHLSVILIAILFSAIHFQFYGFLPRLFLGLILGYLFVWTGSLWVPILFHFINNGASVVAFYILTVTQSNADIDSFGSLSYVWMWIFHLPVFCFAIWYVYKNRISQVIIEH